MGQTVKDNVILLGAPRSGTSFLTSLLHNPPDFICLSEPLQIDVLTEQSRTPGEFVSGLVAFIAKTRENILCGTPIENRIDPHTGTLAENYAVRHEHSADGWVVGSGFEWQTQTLPIPTSRFQLLVKRNAPLVAVIEHLVERDDLTVFGMVRNPVSTILSWRSLDLPISRGHLHSAERISSELRALVQESDLLLRQVKILNWIFGRIVTYLPAHAILCYEDLMDDPGNAVAATGLRLSGEVSQLESRNSSAYYDHSEAKQIREMIEYHAPHILAFQDGRYARA
ncbi:MAG TPA: hypothetical protein EYN18_03560 [Nitrospirales bacterium]|jgi:hypothetical protein|nr:hypothetical protein [Nitrospirales bacterium]HIA14886.1 hypothetical protein [Nitrospirales bacterium]HIB53850.1 hypothetical protein [Nitrospirales bacterium]HIN32946.1 hypothetical protein [Nitrospirales bacterium]HIO21457.1 hypothetical protein [Nitrospirales bacterium]